MSQDQSARLRLGHKRYGGVQNDAPKGGMFICDKCGGIDRISVMTKIGGQEICETCVDQYLIKSAANAKHNHQDLPGSGGRDGCPACVEEGRMVGTWDPRPAKMTKNDKDEAWRPAENELNPKCAACGHVQGQHDGLSGQCFDEANPGDTKAKAHPSDGFKRCSCTKFKHQYENAVVEWKCEKCGRIAKASDIYDDKICMPPDGCGGRMFRIDRKNASMKAPWKCDECDANLATDAAVKEHKSDTGHSSYAPVKNSKYLCPHCDRKVEKKDGRYYCSKCKSCYDMEDLTGEDAQNAKGEKCPSCGSTETFTFKGTHGDNMACSICDRTWKSSAVSNSILNSQLSELIEEARREYGSFERLPLEVIEQIRAIVVQADDDGLRTMAHSGVRFVQTLARTAMRERGLKDWNK